MQSISHTFFGIFHPLELFSQSQKLKYVFKKNWKRKISRAHSLASLSNFSSLHWLSRAAARLVTTVQGL
jgi:hypothetical protein